MSKKQNKWVRTWVNQSTIGARFGVSAIKVGKVLTEQGLKTREGATERAVSEGFATEIVSGDGTVMYRWHKHKVTVLFESLGFERVDPEVERDAKVLQQARRIVAEINRLWDSDNGQDQKLAAIAMDTLDESYPPAVAAKARELLDTH